MTMLEEMQAGMVVSMVVWDLLQETLKVKDSRIWCMQWAWWCVCSTFSKKEDSKFITYQSGDNTTYMYIPYFVTII